MFSGFGQNVNSIQIKNLTNLDNLAFLDHPVLLYYPETQGDQGHQGVRVMLLRCPRETPSRLVTRAVH